MRFPSRGALRTAVVQAVLVAATLAGMGQPAIAAERAATDAPLKYRRIYAPPSGIKDLPRGNVHYLPIEAEEFERLVRTIGSLPTSTATSLAARVVRARYSARLEEDRLRDGHATLDVTHSEEGPVLMPLSPCTLALTRPAAGEGKPEVLLGLRPDGRLAAVVERSGPLELHWSAAGRRDAAGSVEFELELPRCPDNRLELDLPALTVPVTRTGIVLPAGESNGRSRWIVELGGQHRLNIRIAPNDPASERRRLALLHTATTYEISARGVDVTAQWRLDVPHEPLQQLEVALDPGLQLVGARYGEMPVVWSMPREAQGGVSRLVLELPEPVRGASRTLRLTAMAPLRLGESTMLPRIEAKGVAWQDGTLSVLLPEPFQLEQLVAFACRQSKTGPLPAALSGESLELQCFGPDATAQILVARKREPMLVTAATVVKLGAAEKLAQLIADLRVESGERFSVQGHVPREWIIESVATTPDEALADWNLLEDDQRGRLLNLRLAQALTPNHPVQVIVRARGRSSALGKRLSPADLKIVDFESARVQRQWIGLRAAGAYRIQLEGEDEPQRVEFGELDPADRQLLAEQSPELLVQLAASAPRWWASIVPESPRYAASLETIAEVTLKTLRHRWSIACKPDSAAIEKVLVYLTEQHAEAPRWSFGDEQLGRLVSRKLNEKEQTAAGLPARGEAWELRLMHPQAEPFEIRATREIPLGASAPLTLVCAPAAASQEAMLVVRAPGDVPLGVVNQRLDALEPPRNTRADVDATRAAFRYDPQREVGTEAVPAIRLERREGAPSSAGAIAWSLLVDSCFEPGGRAIHRATWRLENRGRPSLPVRIPAESRLIGVWLDGVNHPIGGKEHAPVIPLAHDQQFPTLVVQFETSSAAWRVAGLGQLPAPEIDVPVLAQTRRVWLPPGYSLLGLGAGHREARGPSWSERLLGPLGRAGHRPFFDPTQPEDWRGLAGPADGEHRVELSLMWVTRLGLELTRAAQAGKSITWSELLVDLHTTGGDEPPLLVDRQALAEQDVWPSGEVETPAAAARGEGDLSVGLSLLERHGLVLLVSPDALLLTTGLAAAADDSQLAASDTPGIAIVRPGPLERQMQAGAVRESSRLLNVAGWKAQRPGAWQPGASFASRRAAGWTVERVETLREGHGTVIVLDRTAIDAAAVLACLMTAIFCWWRWRERPVRVFMAWLVLAAVALLVPAELGPIAAGAVLGSSACLAMVCLLPAAPPAEVVLVTARGGSSIGKLAGGTACLLVSLAWSAASLAADAPLASAYQVFIPSDDEGKPTGDRYLVPEDFYQELNRRADEVRGEPSGWLMTGARYDLTLAPAMSGNGLEVADCVAQFEFEVFTPGVSVRVPLDRSGLSEIPRHALVDGRTTVLAWDTSGQAFACEIADLGRYRIEVPLRPTVRTTSDWTGCDITIPRHPLARVSIKLPNEASGVELPTAVSAPLLSDDGKSLTALLGTSDHFIVRWPSSSQGRNATSFDVEELLWLKVRPGSVLLEMKANLSMQSGQLDRLRILADPRLRILPLAGTEWRLIESRVVSGGSLASTDARELRFQSSTPVTEQASWHGTFLLTGTSALGNLRLPRLSVAGAHHARRYLAVNVDPALEFEAEHTEQVQALTPANFTMRWGAASAAPQLACQLPEVETNWALATRPRQPRTAARQSLAISAGSDSVRVQYEAQLLTTDGYTFQHRLVAPPQLDIDDVSVLEDGVQRAAHWGRDSAGIVTVFLTGPVTGSQRLSLVGSVPCKLPGEVALPLVRFEEAKLAGTAINVYRQAPVLATLAAMHDLKDSPEPPAAEPAGPLHDRLIASLVAESESPHGRLRLAPNSVRARVSLATSLRRDGQQWQSENVSVWHVTGGLLDVLRFEVPACWAGPLVISPPSEYELAIVPDRKLRHLLVRPRSPVRDTLRLTISGPLVFGPGEAVALAEIRPLGVDRSQRFFRLPRQVGLQQVAWETTDLRPAELPKELAASATLVDAADTFQSAGIGAEVRLKSVDRVTAVPQVKLADLRIAWERSGQYRGIACFDLEPARAKQCSLVIPEGCRALEVAIDGFCVTPVAKSAQQWDIPLLVPHLPQRVEVVFAGRFAAARAGAVRLSAPALKDLPVERTLWSVDGPDSSGPGEILAGRSVGSLRAELVRLESAAALVKLPIETASSGDELRSWYQVWTGHWSAARDAARRQLLEMPATRETAGLEAELKTLEREQAALATRLGSTASAATTVEAREPPDLWSAALARPRTRARSLFNSASATIAVRYPHADSADWWARLVVVLAAIGVVLLVKLAMRRGLPVADWLRRWPQPLGVMLGLAWWLWLSPSLLGLLLALVSLVSTWRPALRFRRESPTTVLRLGTTR